MLPWLKLASSGRKERASPLPEQYRHHADQRPGRAAAIDNLDLLAPVDGTVVTADMSAGDQVVPGEPVGLSWRIFSSWKVETFDLTERDVPDVHVGQQVIITLDALPDLELSGTVEHISDVYTEKGGDITYTVRIQLDEGDENLRWGMTALVDFINS